MPMPTETLKPESSDEEIRKAISDAVSKLVDEGFPQEQATAIAFEQARKATGKELSPARPARSRSAT